MIKADTLHHYLDYITRQNFPIMEAFDWSSIDEEIDLALKATILDFNIKNAYRLQISTESELVQQIYLDTTIEAVFLYRLERAIFLKSPNAPILGFLASMMKRRTGTEIYYSTSIGEGFNIQHGFGIIVGPRFEIGDNFTIHQGVTLGQKDLNSPDEKIRIKNNVTVFANATILGNISIGENTKIGANSVVLKDLEANSIYAGVPAAKKK